VSILHLTKEIIYKLKALKKPKRGNLYYDEKVLDAAIGFNKYGAYCLPNKSSIRPAVQKVMRNKIYEPQTIEFICKIIKEDKGNIVHAGTFFGDFLPALSKAAVHSNQKIWAFEPNIESYRCAQITLLLNSIENVELINAGLGDKQQQQHLQIKDTKGKHVGGASKIVNKEKTGFTQSIQIECIDDIIPLQNKISLIQLDVEGYELQALKGAISTIQKHFPILILENNPHTIESEWFKENILKLGYKITNTLHNNTVLSIQ